jgi:hypothetical protein
MQVKQVQTPFVICNSNSLLELVIDLANITSQMITMVSETKGLTYLIESSKLH